jgi:dTDP-4-dehydrorhamnose reductase
MTKDKTKVLILGASGMLGNTILRAFRTFHAYEVYGTVRSISSVELFAPELRERIRAGVDVENVDGLIQVFQEVQPRIVINCIGLIKQKAASEDVLSAAPLNALLPHRLARLCGMSDARLVHISTDCVFSGKRGLYCETDQPDAMDVYGRTKLLGEVDYAHAITLRTSIIGHELESKRSLINWFLSQKGSVHGYTRAIFSGLPTVEVARVLHQYVLPNPELHGLYHLSAEPISKFDLLHLVSKIYGKNIDIIPSDSYAVDRSLSSERFRAATGYKPKPWPQLVADMRTFG